MQTRFQRWAMAAISALLLATGAWASESPKGSLVIIGGALRPDNAVVWQRIVDQAGGKGAAIAVFPSASANPEAAGKTTVGHLRRHGADAFLVPLSVRMKEVDYRQAVNDPALVAKVRGAGGVYFTGGDQGRITKALLREDGSRTPLLEAVWQVYQQGGVIAGTSAGAAIMSTTMFHDAKPVLPTLQQGVTDGKEIAPGLGFIGPDVFIDQHLIIRGRFARMLPVMLKKNYKLGLGVDENTAMLVTGGSAVEVIGYKGAILIDLSQATTQAGQADFNLANARISYLDRGDRYDFASKVFTPSAEKASGRVRPATPHYTDTRFYPDILGNTAVADLMQHLIDSRQERTIGLAFGAPDSDQPGLGFEFSFSKVPESLGYFSSANGNEAYSVMNLRLDIRPITLPQPLYRYR